MVSIFVWKKSQDSIMGHVSMLVRAGDAQRKFYVSWYPAGDEVGFAFVFGEEKCVQGKAYLSLKDEIKAVWKGVRPDLAVVINGLDEDKMEGAWNRVRSRGQWCLARKNCSTVVYHLLQEGGAPKESEMKKFAGENGENIAWSEEDHLESRLAREAKNAWTPIRLYNYANALSQWPGRKLKK